MKKKFIWLIVSCLMVAALILAACAPAVVEEKKATVVTKEPEKKAEKVEEVAEKVGPQYGGTITRHMSGSPFAWDIKDTILGVYNWESYIYNYLVTPDWWIDRDLFSYTSREDFWDVANQACWTGALAESWEQPDLQTLIFHLRKGVRWQNKDPVNGREFVADDVEWHFKRLLSFPHLAKHAYVLNIDSVEATDKYTVVFKLKQPWLSAVKFIGLAQGSFITPHEVVDKYGDFRDWRNQVGTGPFILEDYVMDSSLTYSRNPDYWDKDPDGRSLPYVDGARLLIISDTATVVAALRTGVLDFMGPYIPLSWDKRASLESSNPELQWSPSPAGGCFTIWLNNTVEPFNNITVRQALSMATNRQEINDSIFGGTCVTYSWPASHTWTKSIFIPFDEWPENVRELYTYNPEEAKQLLAEAGYPGGFEFSLDCWASGSNAIYLQVVQLVQAYWAEIGVDVEIRPLERATYDALRANFEFEALGSAGSHRGPLEYADRKFRSGVRLNRSRVFDPHIDDLIAQSKQEYDAVKRDKILRELYLYIAEQCNAITMPTQNSWSVWQPWIKGYQGEYIFGYGGAVPYMWVDLDLKKELTGR